MSNQIIIGNAVTLGRASDYATIGVTYPAGSVCTCACGGKTLTAKGTGGTYTFGVPSTGTWSVTATNGIETVSVSVGITAQYQVRSVVLSYDAYAFMAPTPGVTYTDGISGIPAEKMSQYGRAISNNASITNTTSVVYIENGDLHYKISVGDAINLTVSGASYQFVIIGFNHDSLTTPTAYGAATTTGKAGLTLQMRDCLAATYQMNPTNTNADGWDGCSLRTALQGTIKNTMDSAWQSAAKTVNKLASAGSQSASITTSNDTLFLLSEIEVFGSVTYSKSGEGAQYAWYRAGNTKVKTVSGVANWWWERSPYEIDPTGFCGVNSAGVAIATGASYSIGVAFALCI